MLNINTPIHTSQDQPSQKFPTGNITVVSHYWRLNLPIMHQLILRLKTKGMIMEQLESDLPEVRVTASFLGIIAKRKRHDTCKHERSNQEIETLIVHKGTLRSGDKLVIPTSVLLLGDVNPGAIISAVGNILIWGKLRGIAHAGCCGDERTRIVAMHLRPLQLRIGTTIARVPDEKPDLGLAEQACIVEKSIQITPADPIWNNRS
uniref:Possible septum site-determining protein n=1 Tax=Paulinella chromatophora TaxID=39717 RepID=B1X549_PAUCH|nr:possible septum site-determining protein [Paulinella chromatophora]ACB43068.1 possible septum site-determining protein [Paulinella chromatophora]